MKKFKEKFDSLLSTELRTLLGRIPAQRRLTIAVAMIMVMVTAYIAILGWGLYHLGREDAMLEIKHITPLSLPAQEPTAREESTTQNDPKDHFNPHCDAEQ